MDEEEEDVECNIHNVTCNTPFQSPVTKSVQEKDASWSLERRFAAGVLAIMVMYGNVEETILTCNVREHAWLM